MTGMVMQKHILNSWGSFSKKFISQVGLAWIMILYFKMRVRKGERKEDKDGEGRRRGEKEIKRM